MADIGIGLFWEILGDVFTIIFGWVPSWIINKLPVLGADPIDRDIFVYIAAFSGIVFFRWQVKKRFGY